MRLYQLVCISEVVSVRLLSSGAAGLIKESPAEVVQVTRETRPIVWPQDWLRGPGGQTIQASDWSGEARPGDLAINGPISRGSSRTHSSVNPLAVTPTHTPPHSSVQWARGGRRSEVNSRCAAGLPEPRSASLVL